MRAWQLCGDDRHRVTFDPLYLVEEGEKRKAQLSLNGDSSHALWMNDDF